VDKWLWGIVHVEPGMAVTRNESLMPTNPHRRMPKLGVNVLALLLSCLSLAACGSSSSGSKSAVIYTSTPPKTANEGSSVPPRGSPMPRKPSTPNGHSVSGGSLEGGSIPVRGAGLRNPVVRQGLVKFAACLHQNGVTVPVRKHSGSGPVLNIKGINTSSAQFEAAWAKCRSNVDVGRAFHKPEAGSERPGSGARPGAG
jgi:hypothetical protein